MDPNLHDETRQLNTTRKMLDTTKKDKTSDKSENDIRKSALIAGQINSNSVQFKLLLI